VIEGRAGRVQRRRQVVRRRVAVSLLLAQVVVLGAGGTLWAVGVLRRESADATGPGSIRATASNGAVMPSAGGSSGRPSASPQEPVTTTHSVTITSHPTNAAVTLRGGDGTRATGSTPFTGRVVGGTVDITLSLGGYNELREQVALDADVALDLWLDPKGLLLHKVGEFRTGSNPKQVAFTPDSHQIWVTDLGQSGVEVFDALTLDRLASIPTGAYGTVEVTFTKDGSTAYVSQMQTASVFEIDTATFQVRRELSTNSAWSKILVLSPDEASLYVANWSGDDVTEIDLSTGTVRRQIPVVDTPRGLYVTPDGLRLFVAGFGDGELQRVNLATGQSDVLLRTGGAMRHLAGDGVHLYADDMATDEVYVVDLGTESVHKLADTGNTPNTIDLSPDGRVLYVSNRGQNGENYNYPGPEWGSVLVIDTATGEVLDAIVGGNQTTGLDVSPDGSLLAFSDFLDNRVSVFAIPDHEVLVNGGGGRASEHVSELRK
jgi:YVTN family beta-propeller protein